MYPKNRRLRRKKYLGALQDQFSTSRKLQLSSLCNYFLEPKRVWARPSKNVGSSKDESAMKNSLLLWTSKIFINHSFKLCCCPIFDGVVLNRCARVVIVTMLWLQYLNGFMLHFLSPFTTNHNKMLWTLRKYSVHYLEKTANDSLTIRLNITLFD